MFPAIEQYCRLLTGEFDRIGPRRRAALETLASHVVKQLAAGGSAELVFICTHNSRRSQLAQAWSCAAAEFYGVHNIMAHSGGTEATAVSEHTIDALERAGFHAGVLVPGQNTHYWISCDAGKGQLEAFSKRYDHGSIPQGNFIAVM